jgi:hypothetical protein
MKVTVPPNIETSKPPTEPLHFSDIWNNFQIEYFPFLKYKDGMAKVTFLHDDPKEFTNKWNRIQYKMLVKETCSSIDGSSTTKIIATGKRFFAGLRAFCDGVGKLPTELGEVTIKRVGTGFETSFEFII